MAEEYDMRNGELLGNYIYNYVQSMEYHISKKIINLKIRCMKYFVKNKM